jgi:hypothetical protein
MQNTSIVDEEPIVRRGPMLINYDYKL